MNRRFIFALLIFVLNAIPGTSYSQVDCSALDPRVSISKETEGKISGSVDTLYKIVKAGGSIEGRMKEEIINLQQGAATDAKIQIKLRAVYLFCGMVANSPEIPAEKKILLFNLMIKDTSGEQTPEPAAGKTAAVDAKGKSNGADKLENKPSKATLGGSTGNVLFKENFNKSGRWPQAEFPNSGRTSYQNGWYVLQNTSANLAFLFRLNKAGFFPPSVRIQVDVRLNAGPIDKPFGLLLGAADELFANAYGVLIRGDGATEIIRWSDNTGSLELYLPARQQIKTGYGAVNSLVIEIDEANLTYFINGVQVGKYKSPDKIQGYIGLYTNDPGLDVAFDNLKVTQ